MARLAQAQRGKSGKPGPAAKLQPCAARGAAPFSIAEEDLRTVWQLTRCATLPSTRTVWNTGRGVCDCGLRSAGKNLFEGQDHRRDLERRRYRVFGADTLMWVALREPLPKRFGQA
jgi:hypothetical protein